MSEWISKADRDEFEAWKDSFRALLARDVEEWALQLHRFRMNSKDEPLRTQAQKTIDVIEELHRQLKGRAP